MKKLFMLLVVISITLFVHAQSPQKMSYQSVVRNTSGVLVTNQSVGIKISILQGTPVGAMVYQEIYTPNPQTNANGLVSIEIGSGLPLTGTFSAINWASGPYFLKTETDPAGGTNFTIAGTSQLLSVPYALHSKSAATADYNSLSNLPALSISNWNTAYGWGNHAGLYRPIGYVPSWSEITSKPTFATVATSGSYNDLINKPTIVNSQWTTNGSNIFYSGNVGIGLNNPAGMLEIYGNSIDSYPHLLLSETDGYARVSFRTMLASSKHWVLGGHTNQSDGDSQWHLNYYDGSIGKNIFSVYGNSKIAFNGDVGIGTQTPSAKLEVAGQVKITGGSPTAGSVLTSDASGLASWQVPAPDPWLINGNSLYYNSGNVGIGLTFARYKLTIYDDNNSTLGFYNSTSGTTGTDGFTIGTQSAGSPVWIWNWENSNMHFATNNLNRMVINANGRVDIINELNLHSDGAYGGALYVNNNQALWWDGTYFSWGYDGTYNYFADKVTIGNAANPGYMLYVQGNAYTTGTWGSSDARFKKNISKIDNSLDKLMKIRGTSFEFRIDEFKDYQFDEGPQFGFIAQELEKVFPEVVKTDNNGYKSVNYSSMIPVLLEAVKEQQGIIDKMENKIKDLTNLINSLLTNQSSQESK